MKFRAGAVVAVVLAVAMTPSSAQQQGPGMMPPGGMMMPPGMQPPGGMMPPGMQPPGGMMMPPGMQPPGGMMQPGGMMPFGDMAGRGGQMMTLTACPMMAMTPSNQAVSFTDSRIASLTTELAIRDNQRAAWHAYTEAVKREMQGTQSVWQTMQKVMEAKTPVERLDAHASAMESRLTALQRIKPALASLYVTLTPEQKKKADEVLTGSGCML
jgi:LTXXQ motif family protein